MSGIANPTTLASCLSKLKLKQLQAFSLKMGVNQSGTKGHVIERLTDQTRHFKPISPNASVLSFDLGYRNLAYCHLDKDANILDWRRIDLELCSFHPSAVAPIVRDFVKTSIQPQLKNTQAIVVEQQRARSSSGISVFEGTLRVNCVEAILWTALYEAIDHQPNTIMRPIRRQIVDKLFQKELDNIISTHSSTFCNIKSATRKKKQATSLMVQKWLDSGTVIHCETRFKSMFDEEKKKDDLSDCLTQALAWYKWQKSTQQFIDYFQKHNEIMMDI